MFVYANGRFVPAEEAVVSVMDHGFLYGVGLFETVRIYRRRLFLWSEHYARLTAGLAAFQIACRWSEAELVEAILATAAVNDLDDAYVRVNITGGMEGIGLTGEGYARPQLFIFAKKVAPIPEQPPAKTLRTVSIPRQTPEGIVRFKTHSFLNNVLGKQETGSEPGIEGLFLTHDGYLSEGIVSNLFWVRQNRLYTPSGETGILDGITRQFILRLADQLGIPWEEGWYRLEELLFADEAFVSNSIQEIVPVTQVNDRILPQSYGNLTHRLRAAYREAVELSW